MYDIEVTGYDNQSNRLHLFDIDSVDESMVGEGIAFNKEDIEKNLTLFLYPDDADERPSAADLPAVFYGQQRRTAHSG